MSSSDTEMISQTNLAVAIYNPYAEAETTIKTPQESGFDTNNLFMRDRRSGKICDRWGHQLSGLYNMGIPQPGVRLYETVIQLNNFIVFGQWAT